MNVEERFWRKVQKTDSCWNWMGAIAKGSGRFKDEKGVVESHRWAYEKLVGPIPDGLELDHLCRNRACVNPEHLEAVTHRINVLRRIGVSARHARATHCPNGHPYDLFNTYIDPEGYRHCRICKREQFLAFHSRRRTTDFALLDGDEKAKVVALLEEAVK